MDPIPEKFVVTNVRIFKQIADEAYEKMVQSLNANRRPKHDGTEGWILVHDPGQSSFKQAMISIAFTGIWLEALLHLKIVHGHGEKVFGEYDNKSYEEKLRLLQFDDPETMERVGQFRKDRRRLVHEKAYLDQSWQTAQDVAENARKVREILDQHFRK